MATAEETLLKVAELLGQLTTKITEQPVLEPVRFTLGSGRPLDDFLSEFEVYAARSVGSDKKLWVSRLSKYLDEPLLSFFNHLVPYSQDYDYIKSALQDSFGAEELCSPADLLDEFNSSEYNSMEGIRGFVSRLSALAQKVYAGVDQATREELVKRRCVTALPPSISSPLKFWLLSNPKASLQEFMRVGSGLEKSVVTPEAAALSSSAEVVPPVPARRRRDLPSAGEQAAALVSSQSPPVRSGQPDRKECQFCHKPGHDISACYLRNQACFRCGNQGHFVGQCTVTSPSPRTQFMRSPQGPSSSRFTSSAPLPTAPRSAPVTGANALPAACAFCGEPGHAMIRCPHFDNYLETVVDRRLNR